MVGCYLSSKHSSISHWSRAKLGKKSLKTFATHMFTKKRSQKSDRFLSTQLRFHVCIIEIIPQ
ncbi:MAG: hypothetical protein F6K65_04485 [Moorea sp. SIO3C2]|nr:hypothetical protein [Moorena sp. SIO3C2]